MTSPRPADRPRWTVVLTLVSVGVLACIALVLAVRESQDETGRAVTQPPVPTRSASPPEPPAGSPESIPAVSALEAGAVPDDAADDTAALSAALRELAGSGTALHLPSGTYDRDRLTVPDGSRLVGDRASHTWLRGSVKLGGHCRVSDLKVGTDGRSFRFVDGATRSHIEGVTFVGGGSFNSGQDQSVIRFGEGRSASTSPSTTAPSERTRATRTASASSTRVARTPPTITSRGAAAPSRALPAWASSAFSGPRSRCRTPRDTSPSTSSTAPFSRPARSRSRTTRSTRPAIRGSPTAHSSAPVGTTPTRGARPSSSTAPAT